MSVRSSCRLARALDVFGDRWTLLVVRDLLGGPLRFKEFTASIKGIPTNILTERLKRLVETGMAEKVPVAADSKRLAYRLTDKGHALEPIIAAMIDWIEASHASPFRGPFAPDRPEPDLAAGFFEESEHFADLG